MAGLCCGGGGRVQAMLLVLALVLAPGSGFVQGVLRHRYSQYFRPQIPGCAPFWSMEGTPRYLPAGHPTPSRSASA